VSRIERPWEPHVPFSGVSIYREAEDPKKHFTIHELTTFPRAEFADAANETVKRSVAYDGHALIFIHGWNMTFQNAIYRAADLAHNLKFDGVPIVYSWPSGGELREYFYDAESVRQAEPYLKEFRELVAEKTGATRISILAHSLGNALLLRVLRELNHASPNKVKLQEVILAAPDLDGDLFLSLIRDSQGIDRGHHALCLRQ
jgi:esterase/lipase superfamily enzyme